MLPSRAVVDFFAVGCYWNLVTVDYGVMAFGVATGVCGCFGQLMMANAPSVLVGELSLDCLGAADVVLWNWPDVSPPCGVSKGWNLLSLCLSLCYCGVAAMCIAVILVYLAPVMCYLELQWHNGSTVCCGGDQLCLLRLVVDVVAITEPLNAAGVGAGLTFTFMLRLMLPVAYWLMLRPWALDNWLCTLPLVLWVGLVWDGLCVVCWFSRAVPFHVQC
ncbi:hypothetical protein Nepgr_021663 [Nepenthes gracilis]|uniref:Uncharacterized protein n=1 Tax=Nepenthes gracilis TaxID=150966 RepID=A0AAD3SZ62_NEPGR|nr:hypothetical protein Nepgr_021663 [Nepenthes gracilis]